jgi:superfamily II DNA or RNA helicase
MAMKERDYQGAARREAFAAWDRGERSHVLVAPTGAGKTLVQVNVAKEWTRRRGGNVLVIAQDSRELVRQLAAAFRMHTRLSVGVEMGQERVRRDSLPSVVCATVQTFSKRLKDFSRDAFSLIIQDEADHASAKTWRDISNHFWAARIFGCTATPHRHDGRRIPFDSAYRAATHQQLIDDRMISPIEVRDVRIVERKLIVLPSGELAADEEQIQRIWKEEGALHEVVEPTLRLAEDRPTIVFAPKIERAQKLAAMFNRYRPGCARAVWGEMPRAERKEILEAFSARKFQFIVNVGVLGRGIDLPFVSCVVMARMTQSRTVYEQAIGRGWRASEGKDKLLVLDFCENTDRHRLLSALALLIGREADDKTLERAKEILDESNGGVLLDAIDEAEKDLLDSEIRSRVMAKIAIKTRTVDLLIEKISRNDWLTKTNRQIGREFHLDHNTVRLRRPKDIPSPASHPNRHTPIDWDAQPLGVLTDHEVARLTGRALSSVREARTRRSIPPPMEVVGSRSSAADRLRAKISETDWMTKGNAQLARENKSSVSTISKARPQSIPCPPIDPKERLENSTRWWSSLSDEEKDLHRRRCRELGRAAIKDDEERIRKQQSHGGSVGAARRHGERRKVPVERRSREASLAIWNAMTAEQQDAIREAGRRANRK